MNIVIAGPGAVGCLFAALLSARERRITMLDKNRERACELDRNGIRYERDATARRVAVRATIDPDCVADADVVLVCVKAYDTENLMRRIATLIRPETVLVSLQNGIDPLGILARHAGAARTVCAVTAHGATLLGPGHIAHTGIGVTRVAPFQAESDAAARAFAGFLQESGLETVFVADHRRALWSKLAVNAGINPVTALADVPNGGLLEQPDLFDRARRASIEAQRVATAMGIELEYVDAGSELRRICVATAANISSMLQDVRRGKRTEIDAINGAVVRAGRRLGIPTPVNAALIAGVTGMKRR